MIPTWVAVVTAFSLAILALAAIVIAAASVVSALGLRAFLRMLHELAGPAVGDVRALVATVRSAGEGLAGTARELRQRIVAASARTSPTAGPASSCSIGTARRAGCRVRGGAGR